MAFKKVDCTKEMEEIIKKDTQIGEYIKSFILEYERRLNLNKIKFSDKNIFTEELKNGINKIIVK